VENSVTFDRSLDYGATFRFPVTWSYITLAPASAKAVSPHGISRSVKPIVVPPAAPKPIEPIAPTIEVITANKPVVVPPAAAKPVEPVAQTLEVVTTKSHQVLKPTSAAPTGSGLDAKWEMVIPKMARPAPAARPQRAVPQPPRHLAQRPAETSSPATAVAAETSASLSFYSGSEASFVPRRWKMLSLCAAAVVVGGVIALVRPSGEAPTGNDPAPVAAGTWSRRTAYLAGAKDPREILIYSGSDDVNNYRIEFAWVPDTRGVGWLFRGTDSANYYAANLHLLQSGTTPTLSAEHFAVVKGVEGAHTRKVITLGRTLGQVLVRMDANGPAFTLYLQGTPADYWTDERFETGSLGFYEDHGNRPALQSLCFTFYKKSGLQTVVTSLQ
jgi:hypothetical protein